MPGKDRWRNIAADEFGFTVQAPKTNDELSAYGLEPTHKVKTGVVDEATLGKLERARLTARNDSLESINTGMKMRENITTSKAKSIPLNAMLDSHPTEASNQAQYEDYALKEEASTSALRIQAYTKGETTTERVVSKVVKMEQIHTDNTASRSRREDAAIQTADEQTLHPRASGTDAKRAEASPTTSLIHSSASNCEPAVSAEDFLGPSSEDNHQEGTAAFKRPRGRPKGTPLPPQELILPVGTKRLRSGQETSVEDLPGYTSSSGATIDNRLNQEPAIIAEAPPSKRPRGRPLGSRNKKTLSRPPAPAKKPRGRPPKPDHEKKQPVLVQEPDGTWVRRKRGRPPKSAVIQPIFTGGSNALQYLQLDRNDELVQPPAPSVLSSSSNTSLTTGNAFARNLLPAITEAVALEYPPIMEVDEVAVKQGKSSISATPSNPKEDGHLDMVFHAIHQ